MVFPCFWFLAKVRAGSVTRRLTMIRKWLGWPPPSNCYSRLIRARSASNWTQLVGRAEALRGWLVEFPPRNHPRLDEAQEAELRFVGSLVTAAAITPCCPSCWADCRNLMPTTATASTMIGSRAAGGSCPTRPPNPEAIFTEWLHTLVAAGDVNSLTGILELGQDALARVRRRNFPGGTRPAAIIGAGPNDFGVSEFRGHLRAIAPEDRRSPRR